MTSTTTIPTIPLNKLVPFAGNVRKTHRKGFIEELAANIKAHDLQQNLVVIPEGKKFAVVAGGQRLKALRLLAKQGDIKPTHPVPCKIHKGDIDPREISLAENIMRDDMHPADQFEAFRALVDKDIPISDIAVRFAKPEAHIVKLLRLARVSPVILKAYRADELTLEQVMAYAVTDDHAAQENIFANLPAHSRDPRSIREALTQNEISATDDRVKFVTLKAYQEAGGAVRPDLFTDNIYLLNEALLDRLVAAKLERTAKAVTKEGWKWVEFHAEFGHEQKGQFRRIYAQPAPLPPKLASEYAAFEQELEALRDQWNEVEDDSDEPARIGEIEERLEKIEAKRGDDVWTAEQLAIAGAVVTIGYDGTTEILRGLVKPEDMPKKKPAAKPEPEAGTEESQFPAMSAALIESLTAHRSAALAAELEQRPDIVLAAVVHGFAVRVLFGVTAQDSAFQVTASAQPLQRVEGSKAFMQIEASREEWGRSLPATVEDLWLWCLAQKQETLLKLLAFCAATTVNAVRLKNDRPDCARLQHAEMLAAALKLDMKAWFSPDAENYFSRISKRQIFADLQEARGQPPAPAWEKLKKADLAKEAERQVAGKGWLPALLRPAT